MYTAEQRLEIYKRLLRESLSPSEVMVDKKRSTKELGICWMYRMLYNTTVLYGRFEETLPELYAKANPDCSVYMWNDWDEREKALAQCIVELQEGGGIV